MNGLSGHETAVELYTVLRSNRDLSKVLVAMQREHGISKAQAAANADEVLKALAEQEALRGQLSEDAAAVVDALLEDPRFIREESRMEQLHMLRFGLLLYQDPVLAGRLQAGSTGQELFREYYDTQASALSEQELLRQIRELVAGFHLSPQALRAFSRRLRRGNVLATCQALGRQGLRFKSVAAMTLYLRNRDTLTPAEAASAVGSEVDIEATADAVSSGLIANKRAKLLMAAAVLAAVLYMVYVSQDVKVLREQWNAVGATQADKLAVDKGIEQLAQKMCSAAMIAVDLAVLSPMIAEKFGTVATDLRYTHALEESRSAEVLEEMAAQEEQKEQLLAAEAEAQAVWEAEQARLARREAETAECGQNNLRKLRTSV